MSSQSFKPFVFKGLEKHESKAIDSYGDITLSFGKYRENRICDIADGDPEYVKWLLPNLKTETATGKAIHKYFTERIEKLN